MKGFIQNQRQIAHHGGEGVVADVAWSLLLPRKGRKENAGAQTPALHPCLLILRWSLGDGAPDILSGSSHLSQSSLDIPSYIYSNNYSNIYI